MSLVRNWANLDGVNRSCYQTGETEKNLKMLAIGWQDSEVGNPERVTENKMSRSMAGFSLIYVGAQVTKNARKLLKVSGSAYRIRT